MTRVYLFRGKHPLYETLLTHPPDGIEYVPPASGTPSQEYTLYNPGSSMVRKIVDSAFGYLHMPRYVPILRRYDLVHSSRGFIVAGPNKFVVDIEHASSFVGMHHIRLKSERIRHMISRRLQSPRCRRLLPHCQAARKSLSLLSKDTGLLEKSTVLYPVVDAPLTLPQRCGDRSPLVLFMGEYYWKGGREFLRACFDLSEMQDFRVMYISLRVHPPESVLKQARERLDFNYHEGPVHRAHLMRDIYPSTDIFVMPTYIDTFGYAFLEAMAFGIPCIGTRHFAVPEIIEDGVSGILVDTPISYFDDSCAGHPEIRIEDNDCSATAMGVTSAMDRLLGSANLRCTMGTEGRKQVLNGKFSIERRNRILKEVYESALTN